MGMLYVSDEAKARIAELITLALARPIGEDIVRGQVADSLAFIQSQCVHLGTYHARFIIAIATDGKLFRHVSVGCMQPGRKPNTYIVEEVCMLFGFRPHSVDGWLRRECECGCGAVNMMQRYEAN